MPIPKPLRGRDGPYGAEWQYIVRPRILERAGGRFGPERTVLACEACAHVFGLRRWRHRCGKAAVWVAVPVLGPYLGGARCERCHKPDRTAVFTYRVAGVGQAWSQADVLEGEMVWRDSRGEPLEAPPWSLGAKGLPRQVHVVITVAHLDHNWRDSRDKNLAALCQRCHLQHDAPLHADRARYTRCVAKDARRPLLAAGGDYEAEGR